MKTNIPEILADIFQTHQYHYYLHTLGIKTKGISHTHTNQTLSDLTPTTSQ